MNIPLNIDWQQILLHLFNFSILAFGLYYLLYKPVKDFMAKREAHYRAIDDKAEEKLAQAAQAQAEYQARMAAAEDEIARKKSEAVKDIERITAAQLQEAKTQAEQVLNDAQAAAKRTHSKMMADSQGEIVELVMTAAEKLLLEKSASAAFDQFLAAAEQGAEHD